MTIKKINNFLKKFMKFIILFFFVLSVLFLLILILKLQKKDFKSKSRKVFSAVLKKDKYPDAYKAPMLFLKKYSKNHLKDIFSFSDAKYKKYNRIFISSIKTDGDRNNKVDALPAISLGANHLSYFIQNLKFKGFSKNKNIVPSVIFISGKTALIKIKNKKYYVRQGENIKGLFILKIDLSGIGYSSKGKIKFINNE